MEDNYLKYDQGQTYVEEMKDIKKSLKDAIATSSADEDDSEVDGLLQPRSKTKVEKEKEEEDYKAWLAGQTESISDEGLKSSMSGLKSFWSKSDLDDGEKFTINKDCADRYEKWRGKEHLQKLKAKHGDIDEEESDSESEESEDSDAEELTEEVEKDFYK